MTDYQDLKLRELLLYCAGGLVEQSAAGATKLNKLLYFADFAAMRKLGHPISGAEYQRLPHGPAPRRLLPVRNQLLRAGEARLERRVDSFGYAHQILVPTRPARTEVFTSEELAVIDEVIDALKSLNASQASDLSHREAGWQLVEEGETIPYEFAFVLAPSETRLTPTMRSEAERVHAKYGDRLG